MVDRTPEVPHPTCAEHRLLDLENPPRIASIGVEIDGSKDPAVRAADREGRMI
jgi:hypothetical protein